MPPKKRKSKLSRGKPVANGPAEPPKIGEKRGKNDTESRKEPPCSESKKVRVATCSTPSFKDGCRRERKTNDCTERNTTDSTPGAFDGCIWLCGLIRRMASLLILKLWANELFDFCSSDNIDLNFPQFVVEKWPHDMFLTLLVIAIATTVQIAGHQRGVGDYRVGQ